MARVSYDNAETLVYDPVSANRAATRSALYNLGFRHIETAATLDAFAECIKRRPPDLALCEIQGADADLSKRLIDFASGLTYALDGGMQRIADKVFLLTPQNVEVSAEERARLIEKGFFNQS